jgi:hypothetical protein
MNHSSENSVSCVRHGNEKTEAFVCEHLVTGTELGFYFDIVDKGNPFPDAWCARCKRIRQDHGGTWNEESEALINVKLVCGDCYKEIKTRNILDN